MLGHPFMDGNKRTAFFITNQYSKLLGLRGIPPNLPERDIEQVVATWVSAAKGEMGPNELAERLPSFFC
jgi:prophage maintenance system killer protein